MGKKAAKKRVGRPSTIGATEQFNIRVTTELRDNLDVIKRHRGISTNSDAARFAITEQANLCRREAAKA